MPLINVYADEEEDEILKRLGKKWKKSKVDTIKKIIREYKDEE